MVNEIIWSPRAVKTYDAVIEYLLKEWTEREVRNFVLKVDQKLNLLQAQPRIGVRGRKPNYHKTLVHKKVSLIYHYKPLKKEIELVTFWNNLQNPKRLRY